MTRAAQRLIVAGHHGVKGPGEDNWRALLEAGLADALQAAPAPWDPAETIGRFGATPDAEAEAAAPAAPPPFAEPSWLRRPAPREAATAALSPSRAAAPARSDAAGRLRRQAGVLAHALLQRLAEIAPERRRQAAERVLAAQGAGLDAAARIRLVDRALATLEQAELAPLLAAGSRAEVAIAGALPRPGRAALPVSGRIDRLAVAADAVYLADYKSGVRPQGANPPAYVAQLALYRAALAPLYPDRPIRAFLVWLAGAEAVEIPAGELDSALRGVLAEA